MIRKCMITMLVSFISTVQILCVRNDKYANAHVNMTVFYQSRCPDSAKFFEDQLKPTFAELVSRQIVVSLKLVPYGRANTTKSGENITFSCEHGEEECEGNKFHSCIVNQNRADDQTMLNMATCMFDRFTLDGPEEHADSCCEQSGYLSEQFYNYDELRLCATGVEGTKLLYDNGLLTEKWNPYFMPTIVLNGDAGDDEFQHQLKTNLLKTVLKALSEAATAANSKSAKENATQIPHQYKWGSSIPMGSSAGPIFSISLLLTFSISQLNTFILN